MTLAAYLRTVLADAELAEALRLLDRELYQAGALLGALHLEAHDALRPPAVLEDPAVVSIRRRAWCDRVALLDTPECRGCSDAQRQAWRLGPPRRSR